MKWLFSRLGKKDKMNEETKEVKEEKKPSKLKEILDFFLPMVIAVIIALLLKNFVFANAVVPTGSMLNTIQEQDRVIASRLTYKFKDPERYDIIIFVPPDYPDEYYVKRLIGLPGEKIDILDGKVYVTKTDGKMIELEDDFVSPENKDTYNGSFEVPEDSYFFMGDNRDNSVDSRYWITSHYVHRDELVGKVLFRYYPFNTAGKLE